MTEFDPKYIKISSKYLQEKLNSLQVKDTNIFTLAKNKKESSIKRLIGSFFKS